MEFLKGIYVLIIKLRSDVDIEIGALGWQHFVKGSYAYIGSAQINLEKRIFRHLQKEKRKFWHIDYLLNNSEAVVERVLFKKADKTEECFVAAKISRRGEATIGFGCSDCTCKSHLFHIENPGFLPGDMIELRKCEVSS